MSNNNKVNKIMKLLFCFMFFLIVLSMIFIVISAMDDRIFPFSFIIMSICFLVFFIVFAVGAIVIIKNFKTNLYTKKNGKESFGVVVSTRNTKNGSLVVNVKYKEPDGSFKTFDYIVMKNYGFVSGKTIPILVSDKGAIIDEEKIQKDFEINQNVDYGEFDVSYDKENVNQEYSSIDNQEKLTEENNNSFINKSFIKDDYVCSKCGNTFGDGFLYCPNCGADAEKYRVKKASNNRCPICKSEVDENDKFCKNCGNKLK